MRANGVPRGFERGVLYAISTLKREGFEALAGTRRHSPARAEIAITFTIVPIMSINRRVNIFSATFAETLKTPAPQSSVFD